MSNAICPRCGNIMGLNDGHFSCPNCEMYLATWAYPVVARSLQQQAESRQDYGEENEVTAQYAIPH